MGNTRCCSQLICDQLSNKTVSNNPAQRCCNEVEKKLPSSSTNCTRCTKCCSTQEMERIPFPAECSKCASCSDEQPRRPKAGDKITFPSSSTPCNLKNRACVPKCSDLSAEEISRGAQCASDFEANNNPGSQVTSTNKTSGSATYEKNEVIGLTLFVFGLVILILGIIVIF